MDRRAFFVARVCASLPALRVAQFVPPTMAEPSQFNLETAVGRARVGRHGVRWQGLAQACPALRLGRTLWACAHETEPGHKQS